MNTKPPRLSLRQVCKKFAGTDVLCDVSFDVEHGELVSIIGPSGVGKTTLLQLIAGFDRPDCGHIEHARQETAESGAILVFQDYVLFPNMTVIQNIAFGLKARRLSKTRIASMVDEMLVYFRLQDRANAYPSELSGGQKQRVAIARALVIRPSLLLLDEPFANLDRNLKMETALFLRETQRTFKTTTICVTHDLEEALAMSDRIGILLGGNLRQYAPPRDIYLHPVDADTARFMGPVNAIDSRLGEVLGIAPCLVRPEALRITPDANGPGEIVKVHFAGHYTTSTVRILDADLLVYSLEPQGQPGDRVRLHLSPNHTPLPYGADLK